jgi:hypothetical protein
MFRLGSGCLKLGERRRIRKSMEAVAHTVVEQVLYDQDAQAVVALMGQPAAAVDGG